MELDEVGFQHGGRVARGIAGYEDGEEIGRGCGGGRKGGADKREHGGHFVEFFGADVGAVREAEVDLKFPEETNVVSLASSERH